jgi:hypothetical protein
VTAALALGLAKSAAGTPGATLTLSVGSISFPSASPGTTPSIAATQNPMNVAVKTTGAAIWALTVLANGDLTSGGDIIAINNVTWTATGAGFVNGTLSKTTAHILAVGIGSVNFTGTQSYFLANSWNYKSGSYSQTVVYTLVAL